MKEFQLLCLLVCITACEKEVQPAWLALEDYEYIAMFLRSPFDTMQLNLANFDNCENSFKALSYPNAIYRRKGIPDTIVYNHWGVFECVYDSLGRLVYRGNVNCTTFEERFFYELNLDTLRRIVKSSSRNGSDFECDTTIYLVRNGGLINTNARYRDRIYWSEEQNIKYSKSSFEWDCYDLECDNKYELEYLIDGKRGWIKTKQYHKNEERKRAIVRIEDGVPSVIQCKEYNNEVKMFYSYK